VLVQSTWVVGSLDALAELLATHDDLKVTSETTIVLLPAAAAFIGATQAAIELAALFETYEAPVEALMLTDRSSSDETMFAQRVADANVVVLSDGSALHAKSVWLDTTVGEAIRDAETLIAVGPAASVLGDIMIDPRGGAPTIGLGYRSGLVVTGPENDEQLARTRALLGEREVLAVLGPSGILHHDGANWRRVSGDVVTTRGEKSVEL
jgi:cyanophycinase-like exopeptidase